MAALPAPAKARRAAATVGASTAVIGTALIGAPTSVGARVWIAAPSSARVLGAVDLALVPGLVAGRPRWPWMAARVVANLATAGWYQRIGRGTPGQRGPRVVAAALVAVSITDLAVVAALWRDERG